MVDPLVVEQHKDNQVLFISAYSLFMIEEITEWTDVLKVLTTNEQLSMMTLTSKVIGGSLGSGAA